MIPVNNAMGFTGNVDVVTKQILERALELLDKQGWVQGVFSDGERLCPIAALLKSGNEQEDGFPDDAFQLAQGFLRRAVGDRSIIMWNDTEGRTYDEVREVFLKAINATD